MAVEKKKVERTDTEKDSGRPAAMPPEAEPNEKPVMKEESIVPCKLLYRVVPHNGGVVFADPETARFVANIHDAINNSETWGEFRKAMPANEYSRIIRAEFDDHGLPRPKSRDPFSGEKLPGWVEGDYPAWFQEQIDFVVPQSLLERFGRRAAPSTSGSYWEIPEENLEPICAALREMGFELELAQELPFH